MKHKLYIVVSAILLALQIAGQAQNKAGATQDAKADVG